MKTFETYLEEAMSRNETLRLLRMFEESEEEAVEYLYGLTLEQINDIVDVIEYENEILLEKFPSFKESAKYIKDAKYDKETERKGKKSFR